jgi:hypothetical protein
MKTRTFLTIALLAILANACIPSLFPLYTEKDLVTDDRLVGTWNGGENGTWTFERLDYTPNTGLFSPDWSQPGEQKTYKLTVTEMDGKDILEAEFVVHMLALNGQRYLNYRPVDVELHHDFLAWHMVTANNFSRVWLGQDSLSLGFFDPAYLEELIDENRIKISHIRTDKGILITARTTELQKFVIKYGDAEEARLDPDVFRRI